MEQQEIKLRGVSGGGGRGLRLAVFKHAGKGIDVHQEYFRERNDFTRLFFGEGIRIVRGIISIIPNNFSPLTKIFRKYSLKKEGFQSFRATSFVGISSQLKRRNVYHLSASHSTGIPFFSSERIDGFDVKGRYVVWNKLRRANGRRSRVNVKNSVPWFIFNGRWMVRGGRRLIIRFNSCANPFPARIAMKIDSPINKMVSPYIRTWVELLLFLYFTNLSACHFFSMTMRAVNCEYGHA